MSNKHNLNRFIEAQEYIYSGVLEELADGKKYSHWMWFIFPQIDGLGRSSMAKKYAIKSKDEAKAYLSHEVLGKRLIVCCELLLKISDKPIKEILGSPDNLKLRSSMTLFNELSENPIFQKVLDKYFNGREDNRTVKLMEYSIHPNINKIKGK